MIPHKKDKGSRTPQESTVFNNPLDSDIVLEYSGKKFHAHRAILRMSSPFFDRILQSQWPVAKGPVFPLDDDDDPEIVDAMLRHMYNLPYSQQKVDYESDMFKYHIDVFMLADKYDCPSLRKAAVSNFRRIADEFDSHWQFEEDPAMLINAIATICGPDAQQTADRSLRYETLKFCATNYIRIFTYREFQERVRDESLFDGDAMAKLLVNVGSIASKKEHRSRLPDGYPDYTCGTFRHDEDENPYANYDAEGIQTCS